MTQIIKIKWNRAAFRQLNLSRGVAKDLRRRGEAIRDAAGDDYEVQQRRTKGRSRYSARSRVSVSAYSEQAKLENARTNALVRAIDAGR